MICPAPFTSQVLWANGKISMCCNDTTSSEMTLEGEWNSPERMEARKTFLDGGVPDRCKLCFKRESRGDVTLQRWYNQQFDEFPQEEYRVDMPQYLHISPSNKCNLACRMCSPDNSDLFGKLYKDVTPKYQFEIENHRPLGTVDYIRKALPELTNYVFHGGEPMFDPDFMTILKLLATRADDIKVTLITNGMGTKSNGEDVIPWLKKFKELTIMVSFDGDPKVNDYMRALTHSKRVIKNYNTLCRELPNATMNMHSVLTNVFAMNAIAYAKFMMNNPFERIYHISTCVIEYPTMYKISNIPVERRFEITNEIDAYLATHDMSGDTGDSVRRTLEIIKLELFSEPFNITEYVTFMKTNRLMDERVNDNLINVMEVV